MRKITPAMEVKILERAALCDQRMNKAYDKPRFINLPEEFWDYDCAQLALEGAKIIGESNPHTIDVAIIIEKLRHACDRMPTVSSWEDVIECAHFLYMGERGFWPQ